MLGRVRRFTLVTAMIGVVAALGVARTQPRIAQRVHVVKMRDDVYVLPPPAELKAATLGHHSAAVDMLWAKLLVEYGQHWSERRPFADLTKYLDAILALEPDYAPLYKYVDTLLLYRPPEGKLEDARLARRYLERGIRERPNDHVVWLTYGQFLAFLGPSWLPTEEEREQWRHDGALALVHAVELGADAHASLNAAATLSRFGQRPAAVSQLRRAYALTDDPFTREQIARQLGNLEAMVVRDDAERDMKFIESRWRRDYPFLSRGMFLAMGPPVDPYRCAGPEASRELLDCQRAWQARLPSAQRATDDVR
jgi:tetratricopeptide (TPR) repeat protein